MWRPFRVRVGSARKLPLPLGEGWGEGTALRNPATLTPTLSQGKREPGAKETHHE
jgi:hypothetical protein